MLHILAVLILLGLIACQSQPPKSLRVRNTVIYADSRDVLAEAASLINGVASRVPSSIPLNCNAPVTIYILPEAQLPRDVHGVTLGGPFRSSQLVKVYASTWPSSLPHEIFHAYTKESLHAVPRFIQEGLADWYGAVLLDGSPEIRFERWSGLLKHSPSMFVQFMLAAADSTLTRGRRLTHRGCPLNSRFPLHDLVCTDSDAIMSLTPDRRVYAYCLGFAVVESIASTSPELFNASDLSLRAEESPQEYLARLRVPHVAQLEKSAEAITENSDPVSGFVRRMQRDVCSLVNDYKDRFSTEAEFLAALSATAKYEDHQYDLKANADFLRAVSKCWR